MSEPPVLPQFALRLPDPLCAFARNAPNLRYISRKGATSIPEARKETSNSGITEPPEVAGGPCRLLIADFRFRIDEEWREVFNPQAEI